MVPGEVQNLVLHCVFMHCAPVSLFLHLHPPASDAEVGFLQQGPKAGTLTQDCQSSERLAMSYPTSAYIEAQ